MAAQSDIELLRTVLLPILAGAETIATAASSKGQKVGTTALGQIDRLDRIEKERQAAVERAADRETSAELVDLQKQQIQGKIAETGRKKTADQAIRDLLGGAYVEGKAELNPFEQAALISDPNMLLKAKIQRDPLKEALAGLGLSLKQTQLEKAQKTPEQLAKESADKKKKEKEELLPLELDAEKRKIQAKIDAEERAEKRKIEAEQRKAEQAAKKLQEKIEKSKDDFKSTFATYDALSKMVPAKGGIVGLKNVGIAKGKRLVGVDDPLLGMTNMEGIMSNQIARILGGEKGVMTDRDVKRVAAMRYTPYDTPGERATKRKTFEVLTTPGLTPDEIRDKMDLFLADIFKTGNVEGLPPEMQTPSTPQTGKKVGRFQIEVEE